MILASNIFSGGTELTQYFLGTKKDYLLSFSEAKLYERRIAMGIFKRNQFVCKSKYQRQIIMLAFLPSVIIYLFMAVLVCIMYNDLTGVILRESAASSIIFLKNWSMGISATLTFLLIAILTWSFIVSCRLVGPFDRISRELDKAIDAKKKCKLAAREGDDLANDILKRINILIEQLPWEDS